MDRDWYQLLTQTVTASTVTTLGVGGAPSFSTTATTYRARVVNVNRFVHDGRGEGAAVAYEVWLATTGIPSPSARYTLPDGSTPPVVHVSVYPDEHGNHHAKILFGRG